VRFIAVAASVPQVARRSPCPPRQSGGILNGAAVTPFEHLAVFISIVLGLGTTQLLTSVHALVMARGRVRVYWLTIVWTVLIFVNQIEWWWASFGLRQHTTWNFFYFLFVLLSPVTLYLAAASVLPAIEPDKTYDLRAHYYQHGRWFFMTLVAQVVFDAIRRAFQAGTWRDLGAASNAGSALLLASLAFIKRPAYHAVVTLAVAGVFLYFIVTAALQLL
jgi:hypothetical protein